MLGVVPAVVLVLSALPVDFALPDREGTQRRLDDWRDRQLVVAAFLSADCPVAKAYAGRLAELAQRYQGRGVGFVGIDPCRHDDAKDVARFEHEHRLPFPVLLDPALEAADRFGARRVPEVFVLDERRMVRYRGRIDDQDAPGAHRPQPRRHDLVNALEDLLAGRPVRVAITEPAGCPIDRPRATSEAFTYYRNVRPILQQKCVVCHQQGGIAPFALTSYGAASRWAGAMSEVVRDRIMPPWSADPRYGKFANDPTLTDREREVLMAWSAGGAPAGDPATAPPPLPVVAALERHIGPPDLEVALPEPVLVPAEGVIPYQHIEVDPGFTEDRWIQAADVIPGNRRVVHHVNVYLKPPHHSKAATQGELQSLCLIAYAMGTPPLRLPEGMAKKVPKGWKFLFVIHYTPIGTEQTDQTRLALRFADPKRVRQEVATNILLDEKFVIPPHAADYRLVHERRFDRDVLLLALFPHMHLRGVSFRYEVDYPDGRTETLLYVPKWDFNWQHRYELATPLRLPASSVLRGIAVYDNSANNPNNPDPSAEVHVGLQTTDEMFNGYYDFCLADQDLTRFQWPRWLKNPWFGFTLVGLVGLLALARRLLHRPGS